MKLQKPPPPPEADTEYVQASDLVNKVVVLVPKREDTVSTANYGNSEITVVGALELVGTKLVDLGEVSIFWRRLRAQLHGFVGTGECVAGRIEKQGKAYVLVEVDQPTMEVLEKAMDEAEAEAF